MFVLIVWGAALGLAAVVLGIVGFGLVGQVRRLVRAVTEARAELAPRLAALQPPPSSGRHRAG